MKNKKGTLGLCLCLTLTGIMALSGCHGSRDSSSFAVPDSFADGQPIEITFWAKNDTNKTQTRIYEKAIKDFEALYPNITVNMRLYTDYGKIYNDVITNIATQTTPDVCITYPDHICTYLTGSNVVVPLDELIDDASFGLGGSEVRFDSPGKEEVIPEYLEEGKIGEHYYALPFMRSTEACYINKTFVEKLGYELPEILTWDYIWEVAEAATKKNADGTFAVNGQKVMIPFLYKSTDNMMIQALKQQNADYSTEAGDILLFNDVTKDFLYTIAEHVRTGAFSTFKISSYPANFLNAGQCIFAIDSTAGSTWMGSDAPLTDISEDKLVQFETAVRPVPQFDPAHPQMMSQGPSICLFNKENPQQVLSAWLFSQYLLSNEVQTAYARTEGYVPVTSKARDTDSYQEYLARAGEDKEEHYQVKIDATQLLLDNVENTFVAPAFNGSASLRDAASQLIESVAKSVRRKEEINDEYIANLYDSVTSLYHLDQVSRSGEGKASLGPLPAASKALLIGLAVIWCLIGIYLLAERSKKTK